MAEAWHFRYVGTEHSLIMRDENLCLEEYIEKYGPAADGPAPQRSDRRCGIA